MADASLDRQFEGDGDPALDALRDLVEQIEGAGYRDALGHSLERNEAFLEARDLVRGYRSAGNAKPRPPRGDRG